MRILFLTDNFPPEVNAPASRTFEHAIEWVRAGHSVTVITCAPNFPEGKVFPGYKNRWYSRECIEGIELVRVKTYISANEGFLRRTLDYLSFMFAAFLAGLFQQKPDVIVGTSPQFFTVCAARLLSGARKVPYVFELRDLWPDSIQAVGAMQPGRMMRALQRIEMHLYHRATAIISVTHAFRAGLIERGVEENKIHVVPNGVNCSVYFARDKDDALLDQYALKGKFVVGYVGTLGMAHALDGVLQAAESLNDRQDIVFLIVGSGARREPLISMSARAGLKNVVFLERQPKQQMPAIWSLCDVALVTLRNEELFRSVLPSKIFEAMGMGLPLLLSMPEGEATQLVLEHGAGLCVPAEQPSALAEAVEELFANRTLRERLAEQSMAAAHHFSRSTRAMEMLEVLSHVAIDQPGVVRNQVVAAAPDSCPKESSEAV